MTDDSGTVQFTTIYPGWYEDEPFSYMPRLEPLRDQMKPWNGHRNFTLIILSMNWFTHNIHTSTMAP